MARTTVFKSILIGGVCALAISAVAQAQARSFDVPRGDLKVALDTYARQAGVELFYKVDDVRGRTSGGLRGDMDAVEALNRLLEGSGLVATRDASGVVAVAPRPQSDTGATPSAPAAIQVSDIVVTGTRIRGGDTPSPVTVITASQIAEEGFHDLGDVVRSLPQNFSGGQNPGVAVGATAGAGGGITNRNITGGSGLNLRGVGIDATLTLLNGRRMSYGGYSQAVDISAIPVEAVERLEIVADGASAIYGSDAVGGVGNVILKRDLEGLVVGARYGGATDGGLRTTEYSATGGLTWSSGGLLTTYLASSADPIYARQRDYTDQMFDPSTLYPGNDLSSALVSLHQAIGSKMEFRLDALKTNRRQLSNPWNTGQWSDYFEIVTKTETLLVAPSLEVALPLDWTLSIGGSWGQDETKYLQSSVYSEPTGIQPTYFACYCNSASVWEIGAEGPLLALPAGDARLAIGVGTRRNEFADHNLLTDTDTTNGEGESRFAYAELSVPLAGAEQNLPGVRRLDFSAAFRTEDYDSFGSVSTPKLGMIYGPSDDVTLKASWGKSFKAPTLMQQFQSRSAYVIGESYYGGASGEPGASAVGVSGGNPDLQPERATTTSFSAAFHPRAAPGLLAELTWFDIDYTGRVMDPIVDYSRAFGNPAYAPFIIYGPDAATLDAAIASAANFYNYVGVYDPADVVALVNSEYTNVARQRITGVDLSASYRFGLADGQMTLRGSGTYLESEQQSVAGQPWFDISGTLFSPAKIKARAGGVWDRGGFSAAGFIDFTDGVLDEATGVETGSFTTIDVTLRYTTGSGAGRLSGLEIVLAAQSLFDREPPSYAARALDAPPYDSTNYSAIGRFLRLSVSKRW